MTASPLPVATLRQYIATQGKGSAAVRLLITVIDGEVVEVAERNANSPRWSAPLQLEVVS